MVFFPQMTGKSIYSAEETQVFALYFFIDTVACSSSLRRFAVFAFPALVFKTAGSCAFLRQPFYFWCCYLHKIKYLICAKFATYLYLISMGFRPTYALQSAF